MDLLLLAHLKNRWGLVAASWRGADASGASGVLVQFVFGAENFKFSRLVLQSWLQSLPELVVIGVILYRDISPAGPAVVINGPILLQVGCPHSHHSQL